MFKVVVVGICGRMGRELIKIASEMGAEIVAGVGRADDFIEEIAVFKDYSSLPKEIDAIIDFSSASALNDVLAYAVEVNKPLVLASTAYTAEQLDLIKEYSLYIPIFCEQNLSNSIYPYLKCCEMISNSLDCDIEIVEHHHRNKKDIPSGTALRIAEHIKDNSKEKVFNICLDRVGAREEGEIGISSVRGGGVVGEHTTYFLLDNEEISITHKVYDRAVFAKGAIIAASLLIQTKKANGIYCWEDTQKNNE